MATPALHIIPGKKQADRMHPDKPGIRGFTAGAGFLIVHCHFLPKINLAHRASAMENNAHVYRYSCVKTDGSTLRHITPITPSTMPMVSPPLLAVGAIS
jgi:hypothetical protein